MTTSASLEARPGEWTRRVRRYVVGFAIASIAVPAYLVASRPPTLSFEQALLAATIMFIGGAPSFVYLLEGARSALPLLPLHGLFYSLAFGFTTFYPDLDWHQVPPDAITDALILTTAGLLVLYTAYALSGFALFRHLRPVRLPGELPPAGLRLLAWALFAAHLVYQYSPELQELPSLGHLLYPMGWLAMGTLYLQHLDGKLPWLHRIAFFGAALPAELLSRWVSGAVYQVVIVFIFFMLIYWQVRRRMPWTALVGTVVLFVLLNAVKLEYRQMLERSPPEETGILSRAQWFTQLLIESYLDPQTTTQPSRVLTSALNRVDHLALFAYVVETTPEMVPYWDGETYKSFLASVVPRVLWPDKPSASVANEFGRRYQLLYAGNYLTSVNLPWLVEFYVNFGTGGVLLGMMIVGIALRFLVQKLSPPRPTATEYLFGLTLVFQLFYAESNLALMWGGLFLTFVTFYGLLRLAGRRYSW